MYITTKKLTFCEEVFREEGSLFALTKSSFVTSSLYLKSEKENVAVFCQNICYK